MTDYQQELKSFQGLWKGGYFEGDPLDPLGWSSYGPIGFISGIHATYLRCVKPYINEKTVALEIGPGRGAWTKTMLSAQEIWTMDALSAEHNGFWDYIPIEEKSRIRYLEVQDFSCEELPPNHFNYMFSFGTLCHVSFSGMEEYAKNIYPALKKGANCFWMIADYSKYNTAIRSLSNIGIFHRVIQPRFKGKKLTQLLLTLLYGHRKISVGGTLPVDQDDLPSPGRWYDAGLAKTCRMLEDQGYEILDSDVGTSLRDPIIHFRKK